jgi:hypothetical protein
MLAVAAKAWPFALLIAQVSRTLILHVNSDFDFFPFCVVFFAAKAGPCGLLKASGKLLNVSLSSFFFFFYCVL